MTTRLTLFTATLVQDSALSVSGLDRESSADQPFALVKGVPTMVGRGLKGAAVAMAQRFFDPLPRCVSDDIKHGSLRRSAWEFANATATGKERLRAGVGIRQKTAARAQGVLYAREVIPAGTRWSLSFRVDNSYTLSEEEFNEAEGILGYVLLKHWAEGRCWLGGGAARGLGWCHLEDLRVFRLDEASYDTWVSSDRTQLPPQTVDVPTVTPTRSWSFHTLDIDISFGEHQPSPDEAPWGLDMLAVGPHGSESTVQPTGNGNWAKPAWASGIATPMDLSTDRALVMEGSRPLLPGASVRGPIRHAFSRLKRAAGEQVKDPHQFQGDVGDDDPAGKAFGTVNQSSRILIRDGLADGEWSAAKLHMHAEDEFSAGSFDSAKRDAVRLLKGTFPVRIVVEGESVGKVEPLVRLVNQQVALGKLGHLFLGGHKTRGAGAGHWKAKDWEQLDVTGSRTWREPNEPRQDGTNNAEKQATFPGIPQGAEVWVQSERGEVSGELTLGAAAGLARVKLKERLVAWWCEPTIDLRVSKPPSTFGNSWPEKETETLQVDEVAFFFENAVWRAARTAGGTKFVLLEEVNVDKPNARRVSVRHLPARLHSFKRFTAANTGTGGVLLKEWHVGDETLGFTITKENR